MLNFSLHKYCGGSHLYCSFISSDLMRYGSETSSRCRKILTLIFTEGSEWCIFILEYANPPKTEIWLHFEVGLVKAHPRPAIHKHQHSQQVTRCILGTSRSSLDALSGNRMHVERAWSRILACGCCPRYCESFPEDHDERPAVYSFSCQFPFIILLWWSASICPCLPVACVFHIRRPTIRPSAHK